MREGSRARETRVNVSNSKKEKYKIQDSVTNPLSCLTDVSKVYTRPKSFSINGAGKSWYPHVEE